MLVILLLTVALPQTANSEGKIKSFITQDWVKRSYLRDGLLVSTCVGQGATMLCESYKFNGRHLVTDDNYHFYRYVQTAGMLSIGYMISANIRSKDITFTRKARNILGSWMIGRNIGEWFYKANRWGNPFDYNPEHTNNQKALVYFRISFSNGTITDAYIGSNEFTGPLIDMGFLVVGILLLR